MAVERVFSQGRQLIPFTRNGLSSSSIQAFLCVGSWARCGIIGFDDVLAAVVGVLFHDFQLLFEYFDF
jgi:hypothetical protein